MRENELEVCGSFFNKRLLTVKLEQEKYGEKM